MASSRPGPMPLVFFIAVTTLIMLAQFVLLFSGTVGTYVHGPEVDSVLPAPIRRASIIQHRVRAWILAIVVGGAVFATFAAYLLSGMVSLDPWLLAVRLFAVILPLTGTAMLAGILISESYSRLHTRGQTRVDWAIGLSILLLLVFGIPSVTLLDLKPLDDPLIVGTVYYVTPVAKFIGEVPLTGYDFVTLLGWWMLFIGIAWHAQRKEYEAYAYTAWQQVQPGQPLTQEIRPQSELVRRIKRAFRPPYFDLGRGPWAVAGKNLTAALRFPQGVITWMFGMLLIPLLLLFAWVGSSSSFSSFMVLMFAPMIAMMGSGSLSSGVVNERTNVVAQVPSTPAGLLIGYCVAPLILGSAWCGLFATAMLLGGATIA
ncbi:MAG TPA: hypothetical protein VI893_07280, partial [Thermoplasmata archaeon]|nr:hypothetical protein [Thermoplasmata archaeon]